MNQRREVRTIPWGRSIDRPQAPISQIPIYQAPIYQAPIYLIALIIIIITFLAAGCARETLRPEAAGSARLVRSMFVAGIDTFEMGVERMRIMIGKIGADSGSIASARRAFLDARRAYKRIEFLAEQYMPATAKAIDGPVVEEVAEDDPNRIVQPPEGLQVIEMRLYAERPERDTTLAQVAVLASSAKRLRAYVAALELSDANIFDAMRRQVVRVAALGLAGFDASIALSAIPEAAVALESVRDAYETYAERLGEKDSTTRCRLDALFAGAIAELRAHPDFTTFDRLEFIRRYSNPLFADLLVAQRALGIPLPDPRRPLRADATTIFSAAAYDPYAFAPNYFDRADTARIALGRILFFDPILSGNGRRACASCHRPDRAFTDGVPRSVAFDGAASVARNAPTLLNAGLQSGAFYDRRVEFLEDQATEVLNNPAEMHGSLASAVERLRTSPEYGARFASAFPASGDTAINGLNVRIAIAGYIRSLTSLESPFDRYARGESGALEEGAKRGFNLFMGKGKCGTCHFMPLFNGTVPPAFAETESEIIGVPSRYDTTGARLDPDPGRYNVHRIEHDRFMFKVPTLRNVALTAPYMHNGAFATLEQVLDFYNRGGGAGIGITDLRQTLPADPLYLTNEEMADIITFLNSLTDTTATASRPASLPVMAGGMKRKVGGEY